MKRLLVVDDDPDVITFVQAIFGHDRQIDVVAAASGEEALERVRASRPNVILLDVVLPGLDGLETLRALRRGGVEAPVILITSHASMDLALAAMKEGAHDFLTKPIPAAALSRIVRTLLQEDGRGGTPVAPLPGESVRDSAEPSETPLMVGRSPAMVEVFKTVGRVAQTNATVLLSGETGTGKGLVARLIHQHSRRRGRFQVVSCAAIPHTLLESELFGHERGAFTGADRRKPGKFELAESGTLFLDEIGDMPPLMQPKILRALEEREIERLGGTEGIPVSARVVAATSLPLEKRLAEGRFREDLYYRLAVVTIHLPPLRERGSDLRKLTEHFVRCLGPRVGRRIERISEAAHEKLEAYDWPGNVRELRNVLERSLILGRGPLLTTSNLPHLESRGSHYEAGRSLRALAKREVSLEELERRYIVDVLEETDWNRSEAARRLEIHRNTLRSKMQRYGIAPPD